MKFNQLGVLAFSSIILLSCGTKKTASSETKEKQPQTEEPKEVAEASKEKKILSYLSYRTIGGSSGAFIGSMMDRYANEMQKGLPSHAEINRVGEGIEVIVNKSDKQKLLTFLRATKNPAYYDIVVPRGVFSEADLRYFTNSEEETVGFEQVKAPVSTDKIHFGVVATKKLMKEAVSKTE